MAKLETVQGEREYIAGRSSDAFKSHELVPEAARSWLCGRSGSSSYSFRVVLAPGLVLVYGDLPSLMLRVTDRDPLPWLRSSVASGDRDYVLGKIDQAMAHREKFYPGDAMAYLDGELSRESPELAARVRRELRKAGAPQVFEQADDGGESAWRDACLNAGMDDPPTFRGAGSALLWGWECLRCFVKLLPPEGK